MKLFKCRIFDHCFDTGSCEALLNLAQVVFVLPHPEDRDKCLLRMTGEANVFVVLAPFADVREAIEDLHHDT